MTASDTTTPASELRVPLSESGPTLLLQGYDFAERLRTRRARHGDPDAMPLRLAGRSALLLRGPEGVRLFTDTAVVARHGATPRLVATPLFGSGAVHGLDGEAHLQRKAMFVEATRPKEVQRLVSTVAARWGSVMAGWKAGQQVVVEEAAVGVFGRSVLEWAGIELDAQRAEALAAQFATIVDGFAVPGAAYLRAVRARSHTDAWATHLIEDVRRHHVQPEHGSVLDLVAHWTDQGGDPLPAQVAGVELQNVLRPTVAVSRFAAFAALALAQHADWAERLAAERRDGDARPGTPPPGPPGPLALAFAHEVRRLTPFVPLLAGLTRTEVVHRGVVVPAGTRLLLDVVGTNRDERHWPDPLVFDPTRFLPEGGGWEPDALVPQGGGVVATGHRCPGEDTTLGLIAVTASTLAAVRWRLPAQDLRVTHHRMPTRPASGVRLVVEGPVKNPVRGSAEVA